MHDTNTTADDHGIGVRTGRIEWRAEKARDDPDQTTLDTAVWRYPGGTTQAND